MSLLLDPTTDVEIVDEEPEAGWLFVYGTLRSQRSGQGTFVNIAKEWYPATAKGRLWFQGGRHSYPVAKFDREGVIHGEAYLIEDWDNPVVQRTLMIEAGAGYDFWIIPVELRDGTEVDALGFHFLHGVEDRIPIYSGDWTKEVFGGW